jgi:hypothetical protein
MADREKMPAAAKKFPIFSNGYDSHPIRNLSLPRGIDS